MPVVPVLAAIGGGSAAAGAITAGTAALGAYNSIKGASDAKKAANQAANAPAATVNIPALQTQAQNIAIQNAQNSAALEQQFNPGASELRSGSLEALLASLNPATQQTLTNLALGGAPSVSAPGVRPGTSDGNADLLARIQAQAGQPLATQGFDSALTRSAVERAAADLALGGQLPQDVRNLVARTAAARSGSVTGGLGLGRDITARDLGLTSLDLSNRRLQNAAAIGSQEAQLEQANAAMRAQAEQFGRSNLLQSQAAFDAQDARAAQNYATDAQLAAQRDALASSNYFNQANLLGNIASGDFARAFQAAQLGQNISQPVSGLDPGSVANLAVGNVNAVATKAQQDAAARIAAANQQSALGGQLIGVGAGLYANRTQPAYSYTMPAYNVPTGAGLGTNVASIPGWSPNR